MRRDVQNLVRLARELQELAVKLRLVIFAESGGKLEDFANASYGIKAALAALKEARTQMLMVEERLDLLACGLWVSSGMTEPIRTAYCTMSPTPTVLASIPKKETEEWNELLSFLGIPLEVGHLVDVHWPSLMQHLTETLEKGGNIPACVQNDKVKFKLRQTARRLDPLATENDNG